MKSAVLHMKRLIKQQRKDELIGGSLRATEDSGTFQKVSIASQHTRDLRVGETKDASPWNACGAEQVSRIGLR